MYILLMHLLNGVAILATAVVFGTDVFFALVGKKAAAKSKDSSIADLMAHFHEVADARMPFIGITAIVATLLQVIIAGLQTIRGQLAIGALIALLIHLSIYFIISKPVNNVMVEGIKFGRLVSNIRQLQQRWDKVIALRALLLLTAMAGLLMINYAKTVI
jgi:DMSO/TMAO reductase YedYZ heme-binding membrane subunit